VGVLLRRIRYWPSATCRPARDFYRRRESAFRRVDSSCRSRSSMTSIHSAGQGGSALVLMSCATNAARGNYTDNPVKGLELRSMSTRSLAQAISDAGETVSPDRPRHRPTVTRSDMWATPRIRWHADRDPSRARAKKVASAAAHEKGQTVARPAFFSLHDCGSEFQAAITSSSECGSAVPFSLSRLEKRLGR